MTYDVVLLVEKALTAADARQVRSLHEGIDDDETSSTTCCCPWRTPPPGSSPRWARSPRAR